MCVPFLGPNFFIFMQFLANFSQIIHWRSPFGFAPLLGNPGSTATQDYLSGASAESNEPRTLRNWKRIYGQICTKCYNFFTKYSFVFEEVPVKYIEPIKI